MLVNSYKVDISMSTLAVRVNLEHLCFKGLEELYQFELWVSVRLQYIIVVITLITTIYFKFISIIEKQIHLIYINRLNSSIPDDVS